MDFIILLLVFLFPSFKYSDASTGCCHVVRKEQKIHVTCEGCQLKEVPRDLPINTTTLNLRNNDIVELNNDSFANLLYLEYLTLSKNVMYGISPGAFYNLGKLRYLDLADNSLRHTGFDDSVFKDLLELTHLYLDRNNFHLDARYPEEAIAHVKSLQYLRIDIFDGFLFGNGFLSLVNLNQLDVVPSDTKIVPIRNTSFKGLKNSKISQLYLDFEMKTIETGSLSPFCRLESLTLNSRRSLPIQDALGALYGLQGRNMESIKLTSNHFLYSEGVFLEKSHIRFLATICTKNLDLSFSGISGMSMKAILSWKTRRCLEVFNLSRNVIKSPQLFTLLMLFPSLISLYASHEFVTPIRRRRRLKEEKIFYVPESLNNIFMSHNYIWGNLLNITIWKENDIKVIDISYPRGGAGCSDGHVKGLLHLEELNISGVKCQKPNDQLLTYFPSLSRLVAKQCNLGDRLGLSRKSLFTGLYNLSFIDLAFNRIWYLDPNTFKDQSHSLTHLNLSGNDLEHLPLESLEPLRALQHFDVRNNLITTLSSHERSFLDNSSDKLQIRLAGNLFVCNCDHLDLITWFYTTNTVLDKENVSCITPEGTETNIKKFLESFDEFYTGCVSKFWLLISVTLTLACLSFGIVFRVAWSRSVRLRILFHLPKDEGVYLYDIYIVYGDGDSTWVAKTLVPWLDDKNIKNCFDDKSFSLLRDKADNIMDAIDNSRKTVFVVSCKFMEHEWELFAMKLTSIYTFRDGRDDMNIIILLDDIKSSEFPKLVRKNWGVIRPLKWPEGKTTAQESLFWKKLLKRINIGKVSHAKM
ncbi:toll-like receptor 4 [Argopecten irradians]|uniref:toll-like receptor 4 n=1 Tax=Argopecten irradians TaxID=31199 RepID=UPI00371F9C15